MKNKNKDVKMGNGYDDSLVEHFSIEIEDKLKENKYRSLKDTVNFAGKENLETDELNSEKMDSDSVYETPYFNIPEWGLNKYILNKILDYIFGIDKAYLIQALAQVIFTFYLFTRN